MLCDACGAVCVARCVWCYVCGAMRALRCVYCDAVCAQTRHELLDATTLPRAAPRAPRQLRVEHALVQQRDEVRQRVALGEGELVEVFARVLQRVVEQRREDRVDLGGSSP